MESIEEIRRANLKLVIAERASNNAEAFAKLVRKDVGQIRQWVNASKHSATGKPRTYSSESAREMEQALGLLENSLDHPVLGRGAQSQGLQLSEGTISQAFDLLHQVAAHRPDDKRLERINWLMIKVAAKAVTRMEAGANERIVIAEMLAEFATQGE